LQKGIERPQTLVTYDCQSKSFKKESKQKVVARGSGINTNIFSYTQEMKRKASLVHLSFVIHLAFGIVIFAFSMFISCCGYSTRSLLPSYIQKVHIKLFENQTLKVRLDELATDAVLDAFRGGSNLRIVDENSADVVIHGKVSDFSKDPYTYTSDQTVLEYKITVKFSVRCIDKVRNEVFWEGSVSDWATYETDEDSAIDEAVRKTAERLVNTILTNW